ncbi:phosphonate ABC transporter [Massilia sp. KIM]|uniref:phosphonate ABC transporter ATP-binding protein n=1 Tax=Massilia sp. KIM TaxID=1955422 RepID=UPI00098EF4BE|nr:ATP-binding cassette domain-containing protein [Massilia sp. KIM]OON63484.1 phosphonate ABC transporter [Massilia sp. KIM]
MATFRLQGLTVRHLAGDRSVALDALDLQVEAGEQLALIGPSGAGKTTLLATLACAHRPAAGAFEVLGQDPWQLAEDERHRLRARLFLAPQTPPLPPRQRVVTAVLAARLPRWGLWRALASLVKPSDPDAAHAALARFGLGDKLYARVDRLSGGERQRCGLARLMLSSAEALLVDEPISALDPLLARHTLATLREEATARGATLVCSLHQVDMARESFPRLVGLRDGRIVFDAPSSEVSDAMIAELYANERVEPTAPNAHETPDRLAVGACY